MGQVASLSLNLAVTGLESWAQYCQAEHQSTVLQKNIKKKRNKYNLWTLRHYLSYEALRQAGLNLGPDSFQID